MRIRLICVGEPAVLMPARFQTLLGRLRHQDALDAHIAEWTLPQDKHAVARRLQRRGVPAGAVQSAQDRLESDPQLAARGLYVELDHTEQGRRLFENVPVRLSATPGRLRRPAPLIEVRIRRGLASASRS